LAVARLTTKARFSTCWCNDGDKATAVKLMRKLLKKQGFAPDFLVTDKLRSYRAARSEIGLAARHEDVQAGDTSDSPPQEHDAKCGFACHTIVEAKDYVFTAYPKR
jgi:hypothetical protein